MSKKMKKILTVLVLFGAFALVVSAQTDKRIEEIKKIYKETNEKVAEAEGNGEYSSVFLSELVVNKNNGSYPAVGIFRSVFKFYYTYGDREKNPYPNRLLKILVETKRSAQTENYEYLLNEKGQLIFYFENKDDEEFRAYFFAEKPIKFLNGARNLNLNDTNSIQRAKNALAEKRKLVEIFANSLDY